ncbi:hypothetical protein [Motiliproteus sp. SC1-56]|uniref:hypothetical protein n=1 Tax=Motiliproteus sp. SC1-56 TaxID=2799565 RepID=UPI001A8CC753|nr:hypothetical protein [Motiliproteus sp. SC1-56]
MMHGWLRTLLVLALINTGACSYLLYPDRRGPQVSPTTLPDPSHLLIGLIGYRFAFAVDLDAGRLYIPSDGERALKDHRHRLRRIPPEEVPTIADRANIARELTNWLNKPVSVSRLTFYRLKPRRPAGRLLI